MRASTAASRAAASSSPRMASPSTLTLRSKPVGPAPGDVAGERRIAGGHDDAAGLGADALAHDRRDGPWVRCGRRGRRRAGRAGRRGGALGGARAATSSRSWAIARSGWGVRRTSSVRANSRARPSGSASRRPRRSARRRSERVVPSMAARSRRSASSVAAAIRSASPGLGSGITPIEAEGPGGRGRRPRRPRPPWSLMWFPLAGQEPRAVAVIHRPAWSSPPPSRSPATTATA